MAISNTLCLRSVYGAAIVGSIYSITDATTAIPTITMLKVRKARGFKISKPEMYIKTKECMIAPLDPPDGNHAIAIAAALTK